MTISATNKETIFGIFNEGIEKVFKYSSFGLSVIGAEVGDKADVSVIATSRLIGGILPNFIPLGTFGIVTKGRNQNHDYGSLMNVSRTHSTNDPLIGVYSRKVVDSSLKESFILSIGVMGDVTKSALDLPMSSRFNSSETNEFSFKGILERSALRNYCSKVVVTTQERDAMEDKFRRPFNDRFLFTTAEKGTTGKSTLPLLAVYGVPSEVVTYRDTNVQHMGWFTINELQDILKSQEQRRYCGPNNDRISYLMDFDYWSKRIIMDNPSLLAALLIN